MILSKCRNVCIFNDYLKKEYILASLYLSMKCLEDDIDSSQLNYLIYIRYSLKCNALILNGDGLSNHISFLILHVYFSLFMHFLYA